MARASCGCTRIGVPPQVEHDDLVAEAVHLEEGPAGERAHGKGPGVIARSRRGIVIPSRGRRNSAASHGHRALHGVDIASTGRNASPAPIPPRAGAPGEATMTRSPTVRTTLRGAAAALALMGIAFAASAPARALQDTSQPQATEPAPQGAGTPQPPAAEGAVPKPGAVESQPLAPPPGTTQAQETAPADEPGRPGRACPGSEHPRGSRTPLRPPRLPRRPPTCRRWRRRPATRPIPTRSTSSLVRRRRSAPSRAGTTATTR